MTTKRYAVFSKNTLRKLNAIKAIRKFDTREAARSFKRTTGGTSYGIFDNHAMQVIR